MKKFLFIITAVVLLFTACSDDKNGDSGINIPNGSQTNQNLYATGTSAQVTIVVQGNWTATITEQNSSTTPTWVTLSQTSGSAGTYTLSISLGINTSGVERSAVITFISGNESSKIVITQGAKTETGEIPSIKYIKNITQITKNKSRDITLFVKKYSFSYDGIRRVNNISIFVESDNNEDNENYDYNITYSNGTVSLYSKVYYTDYQDYCETDITVNLNSNGYITSGKATEHGNKKGQPFTYSSSWTTLYDNNNIFSIKYTDKYDDRYYERNYVCSWTDGNLTEVSLTSKSKSSETRATASYSEIPNSEIMNLDLNWFIYDSEWFQYLDEYQVFNLMGYYGNRSKKLVESTTDHYYSSEYTTNYTYRFDDDGCITEVNTETEYYTETITVEYN